MSSERAVFMYRVWVGGAIYGPAYYPNITSDRRVNTDIDYVTDCDSQREEPVFLTDLLFGRDVVVKIPQREYLHPYRMIE